MEGDVFDDSYMDTLKRGLMWFAKQGEFDKTGSMTVTLVIDGKERKFKINELLK